MTAEVQAESTALDDGARERPVTGGVLPGTPGKTSPLSAANLKAARLLVALHGLSSFCYGMVLPYTSIYLSEQPGVRAGGVALYYAASGAASLVVALVLASGWVRPPKVALGLLGNVLAAVGYLILPNVGSLPLVLVAAIAVGAGQGCFMAAIIPIMSSLTPEASARRVFAVRYQVLNATLALGSLAAGLLTRMTPDVIWWLFIINAVGYVPVACALLLTRSAGAATRTAPDAGQGGGRHASVSSVPLGLLLRATAGIVVFELLIALFAYSQFESTFPLVAYRLMGMGLGWIPVLIAVNVAVVVVAQYPVTRLLETRSDVFGLRVAVALWVGCYLVAAGAALLPPTAALVGLIISAGMFGLAECAYSCSYYPWMISRVPEGELTRVTALTNGMMGIGAFAGPAIGVALLTTGRPAIVWLSLALVCSLAALATRRYGKRHRPVAVAAGLAAVES